jgi:hypothetical protein
MNNWTDFQIILIIEAFFGFFTRKPFGNEFLSFSNKKFGYNPPINDRQFLRAFGFRYIPYFDDD